MEVDNLLFVEKMVLTGIIVHFHDSVGDQGSLLIEKLSFQLGAMPSTSIVVSGRLGGALCIITTV